MLALNGEETLLKSLFPDDILQRSFGSQDGIPGLKQMLLTRSVNDEGATRIHLAAEKGHIAIVEWIAKCPGVDLTCEAQRTCVGLAAMAGQTEVVSLLLQADQKDCCGMTAFAWAAFLEMAGMLL